MILLIFYLGTASSDTSNNPIPTAQGLRITGQQYLTVSDKWVSSSSGISIYIWIYYRSGEIGNFAQIGIDVISLYCKFICSKPYSQTSKIIFIAYCLYQLKLHSK